MEGSAVRPAASQILPEKRPEGTTHIRDSARIFRSIDSRLGCDRSYLVVMLALMGPLPSNQELQVEDVVEVATPAHWLSTIPRGSKNIFLIVRKPSDPAEYAVPMGEVDGGSEEFRMDDLVYYDDPH